MADASPLVVVTEVFPARGGGLTLFPRITIQAPVKGSFPVRLRLPDGTERLATATLDAAHIRGPLGAFALVRILDVAEGDVPPGTEVWRA
jgi:hypothetical protein